MSSWTEEQAERLTIGLLEEIAEEEGDDSEEEEGDIRLCRMD